MKTKAEYQKQWRDSHPGYQTSDRIRAYKKKWAADRVEYVRDKRRERYLKYRYNISLQDYENMLIKQNGVCGICYKPCPVHGYLSVDHCHTSNKVRGLLCNNCNAGIGMFKDDPQLFKNATEWIENGY